MKKIIACALTLAGLSAAAAATAAGGWTGWGTVTNIYAGYSNGEVFIQGTLPNISGCPKGTMIGFLTDQQKVLSLATAAFLSGKRLNCSVSGSCDGSGYQIGTACNLGN